MYQLFFFTISLRLEKETKLKIKIVQQVMVNKSGVSGCLKNHDTGEKGTVFELPTDPDLKCKWHSFLKQRLPPENLQLVTSNVPEVTYCIDVSSDLRVKLYHKNIPVPLPECYR